MNADPVRNSRAQSTPEKKEIYNRIKFHIMFILLICGVQYSAVAQRMAEEVLAYRGASDASAAVTINEDMFIVADDENNVLRVYGTDRPGMPLFSHDLTDFLGIEPEHPEADIEGATRVAERIYWVTSHGRNKDGQIRPNRYRFFATTVKVEDGNIIIRPVGLVRKDLVHSLLKAKTMQHLGLDKATQFNARKLSKKERRKLAPKEQGLNIEGLCASADGKTLYIGFRNPRPSLIKNLEFSLKALVVPLRNPDAVIESLAVPIFGEPMLWDLGGLGIRSMEYSTFYKAYFIIAGPHDESSKSVLYRWSGKADEPPRFVRDLHALQKDFTPEALVVFPKSERILLLSDDGSLNIKVSNASECMEGELNADGTCPNKFLVDPYKKSFRAFWINP